MADKKGTGLMMVWVDVPSEHEDEFNHWYNEEHLPELLGVPGVLNAARYEAVMSGPNTLPATNSRAPPLWKPLHSLAGNQLNGPKRSGRGW